VEKASGQGFSVFNIHNYLPNENDYRMQSARMLAERMAGRAHGEEPVFATGDFNSSENDAVTRWMKSGTDNPIPCRDSYRDFAPNGSVTTVSGSKLDYIYYPDTPDYRTDSSYVVSTPSGASDHRPIVADVVKTQPVFANPEGYPGVRSGKTPFVAATSASGRLLIKTEPTGMIHRVSVVDLRGRIRKEWKSVSPRRVFDLSCAAKGLCLVRVGTSRGEASVRVPVY
jgi:hypothetical protein